MPSLRSTHQPQRLLVYDDSCRGRAALPGLSHSWWAGSWLYRALGRFDQVLAANSWEQAFRWLAQIDPGRPIGEVQYWGHGKWGRALIAGDALDASWLDAQHPHADLVGIVRARMADRHSLWWFRTCETFGADEGLRFARAWSGGMGCRAAGHTYVIGAWQSGLHVVAPTQLPSWSPDEGLIEGSASDPLRALPSRPREPNTIHCLQGALPSWA